MKKMIYVSLLLLLTGCATYYPHGVIYTEGKTGIQDNGGSTSKTGTACMKSVLGLVATGDASIEAAKAKGGISKVSRINYTAENILGLFGTYCTEVKGE